MVSCEHPSSILVVTLASSFLRCPPACALGVGQDGQEAAPVGQADQEDAMRLTQRTLHSESREEV